MNFDRQDLTNEQLLDLYKQLLKPRLIEEKMLIGYDYDGELTYKKTLQEKAIAKSNLLKFVNDVCKLDVTEEELFNGSILDNFDKAFLNKWQSLTS